MEVYKSWDEVPFDKESLSAEEQKVFEEKFIVPDSPKDKGEEHDEDQQHDVIPAVTSSFERLLTRIDEFDRDGSVSVFRHNTNQSLLVIIDYDPVVQFVIKEYDDAYEVLSYEVGFKYVEPNKDAWIKTQLDKKMFRVYTAMPDDEE